MTKKKAKVKIEEPSVELLEPELLAQDESAGFFNGAKGKAWGLFIVISLLAAGAAAVFVYIAKTKEPEIEPSVTEALVESTPAVEVKEPSVTKSDYSLVVLNGAGVAGEAAKLKDLLVSDGYVVSDVGNAKNQAQRTILTIKTKTPESFTKSLQDFLEKYYVLAPEIEIDDNQSIDATVTIGKEVR